MKKRGEFTEQWLGRSGGGVAGEGALTSPVDLLDEGKTTEVPAVCRALLFATQGAQTRRKKLLLLSIVVQQHAGDIRLELALL